MPNTHKTHLYTLLIFTLLSFAGCVSPKPASLHQSAPAQVCKASVNNVKLAYNIVGHGPPLLMIVGYASTMDSWAPRMITELAKKHRLILFDNRGTGHSTIDATELTIHQMTRDAVHLLDALNIEKTDVMGWSMGSLITQEMLLAYPDRVGKAVLYATAVDAEPVKEALDAMAALETDAFVDRLFPQAWKECNPDIYSRLPGGPAVPADVIKRQYQAIAHWKGTRAELQNIDNEVLILVGQEDRVTPVDQSLAAARGIPGSWLVRFKGADHWMMYQAPGEMAETVDFFLTTQQNLLVPD